MNGLPAIAQKAAFASGQTNQIAIAITRESSSTGVNQSIKAAMVITKHPLIAIRADARLVDLRSRKRIVEHSPLAVET
ncbi:MAG: hypothetical protein AAGE86_07430 [Pseudomonadota bacterium]